jgi:hypothetical protein
VIREDGDGWVFEVPTQNVVPVPPPRPRLSRPAPAAVPVADPTDPAAIPGPPDADTITLRIYPPPWD